MIKLLPFIIIPILVVLGLGYWRSVATKPNSVTSQTTEQGSALVEVPKTLPNATLDSRVKTLEDIVTKLVPQVNSLKPAGSQSGTSNTLESRLSTVEGAVTELKARVSALEKATPAPAGSSSKYPLYIPMGADGGPWNDQTWHTLTEYQVTINPDNYSGYTGMQLEVNFRLSEPNSTGSVRFYNVTDGVSVSSQIDTTSTTYGVQSSSSFKLNSGQKTYSIQVQNTSGKDVLIQFARVKVNF